MTPANTVLIYTQINTKKFCLFSKLELFPKKVNVILKYKEIPIMGLKFFFFLLASVSFLGLTKLYGSRSKSKPGFP